MITRREAFLGGLLTIVWGSARSMCAAQTTRIRRTIGCMLDDDEAEQFLATSTAQQLYFTGNEPIVASSGDRGFDFALAQTLSRIADVLQILPGFAYYDDYDQPNAIATSRRRLARADGAVLFGQRYLRQMLALPEHPDVAVTAVCAHEFGHILQYKRGIARVLNGGQATAKRVELHADYLAGFYAGMRKLRKSDYPAAVFATLQHSSRDYSINSPDHHGTPDERAGAIVRGFEAAHRDRRSLAEAIQIGINYVSRL
jgi:hypothetical protein